MARAVVQREVRRGQRAAQLVAGARDELAPAKQLQAPEDTEGEGEDRQQPRREQRRLERPPDRHQRQRGHRGRRCQRGRRLVLRELSRGTVDQPVAHAPDVDHEAVAAAAELVAQPARVRVQRAGAAQRPEAPDRAQELVLREHARGVGGQRAHERELLLGELDRRAAQPDDPRRRVDFELADAQASRAPAHVGAPQQSLDPRAQLGVAERLADVVVATAVEPPQPIELARAAAHDHERHRRVDAAGHAVRRTYAAHDVQAGAVGQTEVDQGEVGELRLQQPQAVARAVGDEQLVAIGGEVVGQEGARRRVVLDEQDGGGGIGGAHGRSRSRQARSRPLRRDAGDRALTPRAERPGLKHGIDRCAALELRRSVAL